MTRLGHPAPRDQFRAIVAHHTVIRAPAIPGDVAAISSYMRRLQTARPDLGKDVPYSFVIFAGKYPTACVVCEGRGFDRVGAHTAGLNSTRYGVAYGCDGRVDPITEGMREGVRWVGRRIQGDAGATTGHRDHKATACPSDTAYALLPTIQPPFSDLSPHPVFDPKGAVMILVNDTEAQVNWLVWQHDSTTFVRRYGSYRGQGTPMPGATHVIEDALRDGTMTEVA